MKRQLRVACVLLAVIQQSGTAAADPPGFEAITHSPSQLTDGVPDPEIADGSSHIMLATNVTLKLFEKDGDDVTPSGWDLATFFVGEVGVAFDPEVHYDAVPNSSGDRRWWVVAADMPPIIGEQKAAFLLAVTTSNDPTGSWRKYRFEVPGIPPASSDYFWHLDSPNISVDADRVYLNGVVRVYGLVLGYYNTTLIISKAALADAGEEPAPVEVADGDPENLYSLPQRANGACVNFSYPADPCLYLIEPEYEVNTTHDTLELRYVDPEGGGSLSDPVYITVSEYRMPADVPQASPGDTLNTVDGRFWSAVFRNGSIWCTHHVSDPGDTDRVIVRWYEIDLDGWGPGNPTNEPVLVQEGTIDAGGEFHTFFPSIGVQYDGAVAITYCKSSDEDVVTIHGRSRDAIDTAGTLPFSVDFQESGAPWEYNNSWGDYSGTDPDPVETCEFWCAHQFAADEDTWGVWVGPQYSTCIMSPGPGESGGTRGPRVGPDCDADGDVDLFDFVCFQDRFAAGSRSADVNRDGVLDVLDFAGFVDAVTTSRR